MSSLGDMSFGVGEQALAILSMLSKKEPDFADYVDRRYVIETSTVFKKLLKPNK